MKHPSSYLTGPPGWPVHEYLAALGHGAADFEYCTSPRWRHEACRFNPILFGLLYFPHHMTGPDGAIHLSDLHVDMGREARRWAKPGLDIAEVRQAWIAPRGAAKTTWSMIRGAWALAFGHRKFWAWFHSTGRNCTDQFGALFTELCENEKLRADFPNFCTPKDGAGKSTSTDYESVTGAIVKARGLDAKNLGMKVGATRPDLIIIDDPDEDEGNFTYLKKEKRLATIRQSILGMNPRAVVQWTGTTTAYNCMAHDLVRDAIGEHTVDWVRETKIKTRYYPVIMTDPDGSERSLWPEVWPLEWALAERGIRDFELNYMNRPPSARGTLWQQRHFTYGFPRSWVFDKYLLWVDPAVTSHSRSDFTGIAVGGRAINAQSVVIFQSAGIRVTPEGLAHNVQAALRRFPQVLEVKAEGNQGHDFVAHALRDVIHPVTGRPVAVTVPTSSASKPVRFGKAFAWYERCKVRHAQQFRVAEDQMMEFPDGQHDDVADAVCGIVNELLPDAPPAPGPVRTQLRDSMVR